MNLFEVDINKNFKILNSMVFLSEKNFFEFYKLNNLYSDKNTKDEFKNYLLDNSVVYDKNLLKRKSSEDLSNFFKYDFYNKKNMIEGVNSYYPEWQLFYIAINKDNRITITEEDFLKYINLFKYIAQIRFKKYVKRDLYSLLLIDEIDKIFKYRNVFQNNFMQYLDDSKIDEKTLYTYLEFLCVLYIQLKDTEKYKLMWNLESYIEEVIKLLRDHNISMDSIYKKIGGGMYSFLHEVHLYKPLYLEEKKSHFINLLKRIKIFNESIIEKVVNNLITNKKYEDILVSYIELKKRLNANKRSEIVIGAMVRNIVLDVENKLRDSLDEQNKPFDQCLKDLSTYDELFDAIRLEHKNYKKEKPLIYHIEKIINDKEDSKEKYFAIYYNARNYLAHNNINMDKFFWGDDGDRIIVSNVIDSVMILLYAIENNNMEVK